MSIRNELDTAVGVADSLRSLAANVKFTEGMVTQSVAGVNGENADPLVQLAREAVEAQYAEDADSAKALLKEFQKFDDNVKQILADMFVDMSMDAGEKLSTIKAAGMTEKITTDEGGVKKKAGSASKDAYRKPAYDEWDVDAALDDALDHADQHNDNLIKVGNMPNFIADLCGIEGEFYIYRNHAYENMVSIEDAEKAKRPTVRGGKEIHFHNLGKQRMIDAILSLEHPIMTINDSQQHGNPQIVMLLPVLGNNDAPLYAALSFYSDVKINGKFSRKPHIVLTIAERAMRGSNGFDGHQEVINNAIAKGKVLSFDKEKMRDYMSVIANHTGDAGRSVRADGDWFR